jgi:hypothetical protein
MAMPADLGVIRLATPCSQRWDQMTGDRHVRHCKPCDKFVYDMSGLTTDEVRALVIAKEGKICWRFFVRDDGTVLTKDCPVGVKLAARRLYAGIASAVALTLLGAATLARDGGQVGLAMWLKAKSDGLGQKTVPLRSAEKPKRHLTGVLMIDPSKNQY